MASQFETETETDTLGEVENPCPVCLETVDGRINSLHVVVISFVQVYS